jgi:long-chain fatty acid transport protein
MRVKRAVSVCISAVVLPGLVHANGFRNPPETATALGRDGGKLVAIDDASAMAANPANLSGLEAPDLVAGLTLIHTETDYESILGSATTDDPWKALPNAFFAFPIEPGKMAAGVALTTPFGQSTVWEKDSVLRYSVPYHAELRLVNVNPTFAARLSERVAVGVGLDVYQSELKLRQYLPWGSVVGNPAAPDGKMRFDGEGTGVGFNLGVQLQLAEKQHLALVYRSAVEVEYEGDFTVDNIPDPALAAPKTDFESEIEFPAIAAVGYGIQATDRLHIGADIEWIQFSNFDELPLDIGLNNPLLPIPAVPQQWEDTWTYGVSAEYRLNESWVVRGGYKFMETPIPDETLAPTLPDADRHLLTAGIGYASGAHRIDLAYAYSIFDDRSVSGSPDPAFNASYDLSSHLIAITYGIEL